MSTQAQVNNLEQCNETPSFEAILSILDNVKVGVKQVRTSLKIILNTSAAGPEYALPIAHPAKRAKTISRQDRLTV